MNAMKGGVFMRLEDQLKDMILEKYKSVRAFTMALDMPYSTIDSMLKRGIDGASVVTVLKVCMALDIDIEGLLNGKIVPKVPIQKADALANLSDQDLLIASAYHMASDDDKAVVDAALRKYYDCVTGIKEDSEKMA
jgi:hypothetical protein